MLKNYLFFKKSIISPICLSQTLRFEFYTKSFLTSAVSGKKGGTLILSGLTSILYPLVTKLGFMLIQN
ncbi:MAG: hypothetical protein CM15mP102_04730 [Flavobacteriales bacterium]|nr:MAG: hypothetical protein CM15mP102_04730 [Flavobacteriales bacterium]